MVSATKAVDRTLSVYPSVIVLLAGRSLAANKQSVDYGKGTFLVGSGLEATPSGWVQTAVRGHI